MVQFNPAHRPTYSPSQIQQYYERIQLPKSHRDIPVATIIHAKEGLEFLSLLQKHQLAHVPFENLDLHYSAHHSINIEPQYLFHKIVERNTGRGGYCMENSALFGTILKSLGFDVVSVGAKVNEAVQPMAGGKGWKGPVYDGWNHMLNIVTIDGIRYVLDVGFGSSGPVRPLPLVDDQVSVNVGEQEIRLVYGHIPDFTSTSNKIWVYQHRNGTNEPWVPTYAFTDLEFTPSDYNMMNYFMSTHRTSWFTYLIVSVRMLMEDGEIVGDITLFGNEVKKRVKGTSEVLALCESEAERVSALDKFLGIRLSSAERNGIHGRSSEIL